MADNGLILKCLAISKEIFEHLGSGYEEIIYQKAFEVELRCQHIRYESSKIIPIDYKGFNIGENRLDIIVYDTKTSVILELKVIKGCLGGKEKRQLRKYMELLRIDMGLLINFPLSYDEGPKFVMLVKNKSGWFERKLPKELEASSDALQQQIRNLLKNS